MLLLAALSSLQYLSEFIGWVGLLCLLCEAWEGAEAEGDKKERRYYEESGEDGHPEDRRLSFGLWWVEVEGAEGNLREKTQVEDGETEEATREEGVATEEIPDLIVA